MIIVIINIIIKIIIYIYHTWRGKSWRGKFSVHEALQLVSKNTHFSLRSKPLENRRTQGQFDVSDDVVLSSSR